MSTTITTSTIKRLEEIVGDFYSRRLLLHKPQNQPPNSANPPASSHESVENTSDNNFDANVVTVLSVLSCTLICSLGLNSIIRCALRWSSLAANDSSGSNSSARLANTGIKRKALRTFPTVNYSTDIKFPSLDTECVICLSEFTHGDRLRILPKCNHGFHIRCIDKWLSSHSSCPKCRQCLIETCQKIVGCTPASSSHPTAPMAPHETILIIAPLEHEGLIGIYREG